MVSTSSHYLYRNDREITAICLKGKPMNYNKDFKGYDTVAVFCKAKTETLHPIYSFIIIIYGNYKVPVILAFVAN